MAKHFLQAWIDWVHLFLRILKVEREKQYTETPVLVKGDIVQKVICFEDLIAD
jgi:hypothetical protein